MRAQSNWGEARIDVEDQGRKGIDDDFPGFPDKETKSPQMGCWEIYHVPMNPSIGKFRPQNQYPNFFKVFVDLGLIEMN